jgi:hypothetical protein
MSDDIVVRLRNESVINQALGIFDGEGDVSSEAADEIECLRNDRKELLQIAKLFADEGMCRMYDEFGTCIHIDGVCDWHDAEHMWESFCMARGI